VFPDPEVTDDKTEGLPTNTTVADKKHNNKKPTKKDEKAPIDPKHDKDPNHDKTPVKPKPKPMPKPDDSKTNSTETFEPSDSEA
jgi:hypothetical protein